jgi:heme-degrading monooxygenase HmoA
MQSRICKVDKFIVPEAAREPFLKKVRMTHTLLRSMPGFKRDFVLEQVSGPGEFNYVTLVEWSDAAAIETAKAAVQKLHAQIKFNPQEMFDRFGIKADLGNYRPIDMTVT